LLVAAHGETQTKNCASPPFVSLVPAVQEVLQVPSRSSVLEKVQRTQFPAAEFAHKAQSVSQAIQVSVLVGL